MPLSRLADNDECKVSTRAALGDAPFTTAWAEGRVMTLEQAIEYALASDGHDAEPPTLGEG